MTIIVVVVPMNPLQSVKNLPQAFLKWMNFQYLFPSCFSRLSGASPSFSEIIYLILLSEQLLSIQACYDKCTTNLLLLFSLTSSFIHATNIDWLPNKWRSQCSVWKYPEWASQMCSHGSRNLSSKCGAQMF